MTLPAPVCRPRSSRRASPSLSGVASLRGLGIALQLTCLAGGVGCSDSVTEVAPIRLDVRACLVPASAVAEAESPEPRHDLFCAQALSERPDLALQACLALRVGSRDEPPLAFDLVDGALVPRSSPTLQLAAGEAIALKLFMVPQAELLAAACQGFTVSTVCGAGPEGSAGARCMFAFGRETAVVKGERRLTITYGTPDRPCGIECNDPCAPGDAGCRRICYSPDAPAQQLCSGRDDDCDGQTDEGFELGQPCPAVGGAGSPCLEGIWECDPLTLGRICSTHPGGSDARAVAEVCNGVDDDCDGGVDQGLGLGDDCVLPGVCGQGTWRCAADGATECSSLDAQAAEQCDGRDDDCDGETDEDWAELGAACDGVGECGAGRQVCAEDHGGVCCSADPSCSGQPADTEVCDGADNDCDGMTDEDSELGQPCAGTGGAGSPCVEGVWECDPRTLGRLCSTHPGGGDDRSQPERCDGADNDCDGVVDDGLDLGEPCLLPGVCGPSMWRCAADGSVECGSIDRMQPEACDGLDNDCDTATDEEWPQRGDECEAVGACGAGSLVCSLDGGGVCCSADPECTGRPPDSELCDGRDNDCDGSVDEDFELQTRCEPVGALGATACVAGLWECDGEGRDRICSTHPGGADDRSDVEACNQLDDNCDGEIDEGMQLGERCFLPGICGQGQRRCAADGGVECSSTDEVVAELCNSLDDDCDGAVDEEWPTLGADCEAEGACGLGTLICAPGADSVCCSADPECSGQPAGTELCDGVDNDCDGAVDEDFALGLRCPGVPNSPCGEGVWECDRATGGRRCSTHPGGSTSAAVPEDCNGEDDDCDGRVDEELVLPPADLTRGVCAGQTKRCSDAGELLEPDYAEIDTYEGAERRCDGLDNDCDGVIDAEDPDLRAPEALLHRGVCAGQRQTCQGVDGWVEPNYADLPGYEAVEVSCDVVDNDCDGLVDEELGLDEPCSLPGECGAGRWRCDGSGGLQCDSIDRAVEEICDTLDNDCDSRVDETWPTLSTRCAGEGQCADASGIVICNELGVLPGPVCCSIDPRCTNVATDVELCDGLDNDCDAVVDEDFELGEPCPAIPNSPCVAGLWECDSAQQGRVCSTHPGGDDDLSGPESCDGVDDDCDGEVDERDEGGALEQVCYTGADDTRGEGECHDGVQRCGPGGGWGECADEQLPVEEVCDGLDNDCDGLTDEDELGDPLTRGCYDGQQDTEGEGLCHAGQQTCALGGRWGACVGQQLPVAELCNDADDDCDGATDEDELGAPLVRGCYDGAAGTEDVGLCHGGQQTCGALGQWGACVDQQLPAPETCNGDDDDCDRVVDEDELGLTLTQACYGGEADTRGVGECADGSQRCVAGGWGACVDDQRPRDEVCNGDDDDCDGLTDEGDDDLPLSQACYRGSDRTRGVGECHDGSAACVAGEWGACGGDQLPVQERCNGDDDDCDGSTDEDELERPLVQACWGGLVQERGVGECSDGAQTCVLGAWDACTGEQRPSVERCNGDDDDCDGATDEAGNGSPLSQACFDGSADNRGVGECHDGTQSCTAGEWGTCTGDQLPVGETCNGDDDDCDGATDEDLAGDPLSRGCYDGSAQTRGVGLCRDGSQQCSVGVWGECLGDRLPAASEACNGDDDDCDGLTDEGADGGVLNRACYTGAPETLGVGICHGGTQTCSDRSWGGCVGEQVPLAEYVPNSLDDDCDRSVDEHPCGVHAYFSPTGHCYRFLDSAKEWTEARDWCNDNGYYLVDILSEAENVFVRSLTAHSIWIAFNDRGDEGQWEWATGAGVTFVRWNEGEPNNSGSWPGPYEDCAEMWGGGLWNDSTCSDNKRFVCEWTP